VGNFAVVINATIPQSGRGGTSLFRRKHNHSLPKNRR
jgi:hypothetical protein